ncbi:helix-turn-helix domain-containing protein, partial [Acetobacter farinalis]
LLKTQIKSSPENRQSNRQNPEITGQAHQSTVLRSLHLIRTRTAEGRELAKKRGIKMGRPQRITEKQKVQILKRRSEGQTLYEIAKDYDIVPSTVLRIVNKSSAPIA